MRDRLLSRVASARDSRHPECRATSGQAHSKINRAGSELRLLEFVSTIAALYLLVSLSRHLVSVRLGATAARDPETQHQLVAKRRRCCVGDRQLAIPLPFRPSWASTAISLDRPKTSLGIRRAMVSLLDAAAVSPHSPSPTGGQLDQRHRSETGKALYSI